MRPLDPTSARYLILKVAGIYIVLLGVVELAQRVGVMHPLTAGEVLRTLTTLASLTVGSVIGYFVASRSRRTRH